MAEEYWADEDQTLYAGPVYIGLGAKINVDLNEILTYHVREDFRNALRVNRSEKEWNVTSYWPNGDGVLRVWTEYWISTENEDISGEMTLVDTLDQDLWETIQSGYAYHEAIEHAKELARQHPVEERGHRGRGEPEPSADTANS